MRLFGTPSRHRAPKRTTKSVGLLRVVWIVALLLLFTVVSQCPSTLDDFVFVRAQHPIVKFLQMHTTHRDQTMNRMSRSVIMSGEGNENDIDEEETQCRPVQERLKVVEAKLQQSESIRHELVTQKEQLQQDYQQQHQKHDDTMLQIQDKLQSALKIATIQEELAQRTIQLHNTTQQELQRVSHELVLLQQEYQSTQTQHQTVVTQLQQSLDQQLHEVTTKCQNRIEEEILKSAAATTTATVASTIEPPPNQLLEQQQHQLQQQQQQQFEDKLQLLQTEKNTCNGEMQALKTQLYRTEMKYEGILKEYDIALQNYIQVHFDQAVQNETEIAVQVVQQEYTTYQTNCGRSIQQLQNELRNTTSTLNVTIQECEESTTQLQSLMKQQQHIMQEDYNLQQQEWKTIFDQTLHAHREEISDVRQSLQTQCDTTTELLRNEHNHTVVEYETTIQNLSETYNTTMSEYEMKNEILQDRYQTLQTQYQQQQDALGQLQLLYEQLQISQQYWESTFHQRSYINITYMYMDAHNYMTQQLPDKVQTLYIQPYLVRPIQIWYSQIRNYYQYTLIQEHIEPLIQSMTDTYQQQVVVPYGRPLYHSYTIHIHPHVIQMQQWYMTYGHPHTKNMMQLLQNKYDTHVYPKQVAGYHQIFLFVEGIQTLYDESILHYQTIQCPKLQQSITMPLSSSSSSISNTTHSTKTATSSSRNVALQMIQYTCTHTHETIILFVKIVGGIVLVVFHQSILRLIWYMARTIFVGIIYTYNPIRLLYLLIFGRRRRPKQPSPLVVVMNGNHTTTTTEDDLYMDPNEK